MKKVIILAQQGSGTHLFRSFMNSHPDIFIDGEWFVTRKKKNFSKFQLSDTKDKKQFLDESFEVHDLNVLLKKEQCVEVFGFDLKYNQIDNEIACWINDNNVSVIHLLRNPGRSFVKTHFNSPGTVATYEQLVLYCQQVNNNIARYRLLFQQPHINYLEITFEEMTLGREIKKLPVPFEARVLGFLDVDLERLSLTNVNKELKIRY